MPLSMPIAKPVRIVSCAFAGPIEITIVSEAAPLSFSLTACSTEISSKGFIDILTFAKSTPD